MWRSTSAMPGPDMYSNAWMLPGSWRRKRPNRSSAASGEGTAHNATATSAGAATSLSTAAVMKPRVPSLPTNNWRRQ